MAVILCDNNCAVEIECPLKVVVLNDQTKQPLLKSIRVDLGLPAPTNELQRCRVVLPYGE